MKKSFKVSAQISNKGKKQQIGTTLPTRLRYWLKKESVKYGGISAFIRNLVVKEYERREA